VKWERDQEELEELRILLPLEDEFFGDFKDPWFEGEDQPGFPSIATILNN
jgi:hypothetical protein